MTMSGMKIAREQASGEDRKNIRKREAEE